MVWLGCGQQPHPSSLEIPSREPRHADRPDLKAVQAFLDQAADAKESVSDTIDKQRFAFVMTAIGLVCLNPDTGEVDWEIDHYSRAPMSYNSVSPMVAKV